MHAGKRETFWVCAFLVKRHMRVSSIMMSHVSFWYVSVTLLWGSYAQHDASQTELHLPAFTAAPDSLLLAVKQFFS